MLRDASMLILWLHCYVCIIFPLGSPTKRRPALQDRRKPALQPVHRVCVQSPSYKRSKFRCEVLEFCQLVLAGRWYG